MKHFYLDIADFNNDVDTCLKQALAYAVTAAEASNIERIVIISPTNRVSINVAAILIALGCREANGTFNIIGSSINIVLNSIATYNNFDTDAVIYFALSSKEIFKIEEQRTFGLEIAIKEYCDIDLWKGTWSAVNPQTKASIKLEPNDKVKHAFDQLTRTVNITHSVCFHPSDEDCVKKFIRTLVEFEATPVNPDDVFAYLKRDKNWSIALCDQVREWISKLNNGGTFKGGKATKTEMKTLYSNW